MNEVAMLKILQLKIDWLNVTSYPLFRCSETLDSGSGLRSREVMTKPTRVKKVEITLAVKTCFLVVRTDERVVRPAC